MNRSSLQYYVQGRCAIFGLQTVLALIVAFYGTALLTIAGIVSVTIWIAVTFWQAGKGQAQFRDEVLVLASSAMACALPLALGIGSWAMAVDFQYRPDLMTRAHYLQFLGFNASLAVLVLRAKARELDAVVVANVARTFLRTAVATNVGFNALAYVATSITFRDNAVFLTSLAPLAIALTALPLFRRTNPQPST